MSDDVLPSNLLLSTVLLDGVQYVKSQSIHPIKPCHWPNLVLPLAGSMLLRSHLSVAPCPA
jgi:hypothetical protein